MPRIDALVDSILNHIYRNTTFTSPINVFASLLTAVTDLEAGTVVEASWAGAARVAITFGAPTAGLNGRQVANSAAVTFAQKTDVGSVTAIAVGIYDLITLGVLLDVIFLDDTAKEPEIGLVSDLVGNNIEVPSTAFVDNDTVRLESVPGTGALPTGLSLDVTYFVVGATADTIQLSLTMGGAAIDITADGGMMIMPTLDKVVSQNDTPEFAIGTLITAAD